MANLRKVSLYEAIVAHCRGALPFLAFPPASVIHVDGEPLIFLDGQQLSVRKGSFLEQSRVRDRDRLVRLQ